MFIAALFVATLIAGANAFGNMACSTNAAYRLNGTIPTTNTVTPNTKIAFIGDNNVDTLELIQDEGGVSLIVHAGDFDYDDDADLFAEQIEDVLGTSFPYIISIGNHDVDAWGDYHEYFYGRYQRSGLSSVCIGDIGINHVCNWRGVLIVGTAVGTCSYSQQSHMDYVDNILSTYGSAWRVVHHHKNQEVYQLCTKSDETGYGILDMARAHGAIVDTGHEHSYARTQTMTNFQTRQYVANTFNPTLDLGRTFPFCSGLGGESIRDECDGLGDQGHWAAWAAGNGCEGGNCPANGNRDADYGALFCTFNVNGQGSTNCYFKDITGFVFDNFTVTSNVPSTPTKALRDPCTMPFLEFSVSSGADDLVLRKGKSKSSAESVLTLSKDSSIMVTIRNIDLPRNARVHHAALQFYSASAADKSIPNPEINIRAVHDGQVADTVIPWMTESEDWERHTVWNTDSIATLIAEITAKPSWNAGDDITFIISTTGIPRQVYSIEHGRWFAPTLAVELESPCDQ